MTKQNPLGWSVRVSSSDPQGAVVYARKHRSELGAPISFDAEAELPSAVESLLGAIGADLVCGLKDRCKKNRLEVDNVEAVVQGELENPLSYLRVVGEEGSPRLARVTLKIYVETLEDDTAVQNIWDDVLAHSPLYLTLSPVVQFNIDLQIIM
jgi:hypothetical protein